MTQPGYTKRPPDIRYVGRQAGRYALPGRQTSSGVSVFSCQTQSISPAQVVIAAPVLGEPGARVSANIDEVGIVRGFVDRIVDRGFAIRVDPDDNDLNQLTARINWLKKRVTQQVGDSRAHKRFRPRNPHSRLLLGNGVQLDCFLIDLSRSGAALSADLAPKIGEPLAVGKMIGRVVRMFEGGFAIEFIEPAAPGALEHLVTACDFDNLPADLGSLFGT